MSDENALLPCHRGIAGRPGAVSPWSTPTGARRTPSRGLPLIRGQCFLYSILPVPDPSVYGSQADPHTIRPAPLADPPREPPRAVPRVRRFRGLGVGRGPRDHVRLVPVVPHRRGFIEWLSLTGLRDLAAWVSHGHDILSRVPVRRLEVRRRLGVPGPQHRPADDLAALLAVKGIERVPELRLEGLSLGPAAAETLLRLGGHLRLTSLRVSQRTLSQPTLRGLRVRFGRRGPRHPRCSPGREGSRSDRGALES